MPYCSDVVAQEFSIPMPARSVVAVPPPGSGPGMWAGAPSAVCDGDAIYLAYRLRRPIGQGRGYAVVVARSADGEHFETISTVTKEQLSAESLERPALIRATDGTWRLYLSCATPGTKHWRVEVIGAAEPGSFDPRRSEVVLPGDTKTAVKDTVIMHHEGLWHLWASTHPLADPLETDQMVTEYASSADGLEWTWEGTALSTRPGEWDSRGVRVSAVRFTADGVVNAITLGTGGSGYTTAPTITISPSSSIGLAVSAEDSFGNVVPSLRSPASRAPAPIGGAAGARAQPARCPRPAACRSEGTRRSMLLPVSSACS